MIEVDQVRDCKRMHAKGLGIRAVARELGIARRTVKGYLSGSRTAGQYSMAQDRPQPVRAELRPRVLELLEAEQESQTPRKQRLTAARIHRLLVADGLRCSGSSVRRVVREVRLELRDPLEHAYLPLEYEPGEDAQVDFFEGVADDKTLGRVTVFILLVRACFSGKTFLYAAPNQTREALLEGLMRAFEFFDGVFQTLWFDNLTPAVKRVLQGRSRELQRGFEVFQAHYGFKAEFCAPGKGNEKGGVEGYVKFARHETLSPIPAIDGREDLQQIFGGFMTGEDARTTEGRAQTIGELFALEKPHLMPLPKARFDASRPKVTTVRPRSWISIATNVYSVPVEWVGHDVIVKLEAESVVIVHKQDPPVRHPRSYDRFRAVLELDHYLPLLRRKSRGLDRSAPFRRFAETAPSCWISYLSALRLRRGEVEGTREFVDTLLLCRLWGLDAVSAAVERSIRHPEVSESAVRYHLWRTAEQEKPDPTPIGYQGPQVAVGSTQDYGVLCRLSEGGDHE